MLVNGPNAETMFADVAHLVVDDELQPELVEFWLTHGIGPPQVGVLNIQLRELIWRKSDLPIFAGCKGDRLLDLKRAVVRTGDRGAENAAGALCGVVVNVGPDRQTCAVCAG